MYRITYGDTVIYDPRSESDIVTDIEAKLALNEACSLTFSMPATHPASGTLRIHQKHPEMVLERDGKELFRGRIIQADTDFYGTTVVTCEGQRAYLNDVLLPIYDTSDGTGGAPSTVDGLFAWYIEQYNTHCEEGFSFAIGINEGASLDPNNYIYRASEQRPSVWSEIREKLLDSLGGYIRTRMVDGVRTIDYLAGVVNTSRQSIDLGVNLLDFARTQDATEHYTVCIPIGKREATDDDDSTELTIADYPDGYVDGTIYKSGIRLIDTYEAGRCGNVEYVYNSEAETVDGLVQSGVTSLKTQDYSDGFTVSAFDLSMIGKAKDQLREGELIKVTSKPHGLDGVGIICTSRTVHPLAPESDTYELGALSTSLTDYERGKIGASVIATEEAARKATRAARAAEQKKRVFMTQPTPPYDIGDLWVRTLEDGSTVVMACTTAKEA